MTLINSMDYYDEPQYEGKGMTLAYRYISDLTESTYGSIQLMCEESTGQKVIVKTMKNKQYQSHFQRERQVLEYVQQLNGHSNIIHLIEVFESTNSIHIIEEFCPYGDLLTFVLNQTNQRLLEIHSKQIVYQMASALSFLHDHQICHLDISLENIVLKQMEKPNQLICKLIDFGFATFGDKMVNVHYGKLFYAAPEIQKSALYKKGTNQAPLYDASKADVWSLGVVLFMIMTGSPLVGESSVADLHYRILKTKGLKFLLESMNRLEFISPLCLHLLERMLTIDPFQRFTMKQVCEHEWISEFHHQTSKQYYEIPKFVDARKKRNLNGISDTWSLPQRLRVQ